MQWLSFRYLSTFWLCWGDSEMMVFEKGYDVVSMWCIEIVFLANAPLVWSDHLKKCSHWVWFGRKRNIDILWSFVNNISSTVEMSVQCNYDSDRFNEGIRTKRIGSVWCWFCIKHLLFKMLRWSIYKFSCSCAVEHRALSSVPFELRSALLDEWL